MRKLLKGLTAGLVCLLLVACVQVIRNSGDEAVTRRADGALRVATLNVHYIILREETGPWSLGDWARRRGPLDLAFKAVGADVFAFQEMESFGGGSESAVNLTLDWLLERTPDYAAAAVGPVAEFPSTQPILYRRDRLRLVDQGWFFFSDTPDVIYSRTFDGSWPAFASWAEFETRAGERLRVVNQHYEYRSGSNRLKSAALVAERIAPWIEAGERLLVVGDFNARHGSDTLGILEARGVRYLPVRGSTYHFNRGLNLFGAIDHIGWHGALRPLGEPVVLRDRFAGEWPTDHYPVLADFALD